MHRRALVAPALAATLLLGGCADDRPDEPDGTDGASSTAPSAPPAEYVALGDSYAAAPGVPPPGPADGCFRSRSNYAQVLADAEGLTLADATCSGATSTEVIEEQVPELSAGTELVTVGIGGNDFNLFTRLIGSCAGLAPSDPDGAPCTEEVGAEVAATLPRIGENIGRVLDAVVEAAPQARVVVVGYPTLLPSTGSCPELVPLAVGDYALVNTVTEGLSDQLRREATERDLAFVDLAGPSRGHDICSADPWVNGATTAPDGTIPFHPFAAEQEAVARLVARVL